MNMMNCLLEWTSGSIGKHWLKVINCYSLQFILLRILGARWVLELSGFITPFSLKSHSVEVFRIPITSSLGGGNITRVIRHRLSIRELLLQDDGHCLSSLLMDMNVLVETQERVLQEISEVVRSAGTSPISIGVTFYESDGYDNDDEVVDTIMRDHEGKLIPATKSSIEALEKVTLQQDELDSVAACVICTQEFEAGLEVTCMPCSHVYHEECIVKWLKRSNVCPLCRYSMPHRLWRIEFFNQFVFQS